MSGPRREMVAAHCAPPITSVLHSVLLRLLQHWKHVPSAIVRYKAARETNQTFASIHRVMILVRTDCMACTLMHDDRR